MQLLFFIEKLEEEAKGIEKEVYKIILGINTGIIKNSRVLAEGLEKKIKKHDEIVKRLNMIRNSEKF